MKKMLVSGCGLQGMSNRMPEIQNPAQVAFALIGGNHFRFQAHRFCNCPSQEFRVTAQVTDGRTAQTLEEFSISDNAALQSLIHPGAELAIGECAQGFGINQDQLRLIKSPDQIFSAAKVHSRFPPNSGIELRLNSGRNLNQLHAAHVHGSQHPGDIADNTAAESKYYSTPIGAERDHLVGQHLKRGKTLKPLPFRHFDNPNRESAGFERTHQCLTPVAADSGDRDHV